jgi:hypothetical protein
MKFDAAVAVSLTRQMHCTFVATTLLNESEGRGWLANLSK